MRTVVAGDSTTRSVVSSCAPEGGDEADGELLSGSGRSFGTAAAGVGAGDGEAMAGAAVTRVAAVTTAATGGRTAGRAGSGEDVKTGREAFAVPAVTSGGIGEEVVTCELSFA